MTIYIYSVSNIYHTTCICLSHIPKFSHRINSPILQNTETYKHKNKQHLPAPKNSHRLAPTQQNIYRWPHRKLLKTHTHRNRRSIQALDTNGALSTQIITRHSSSTKNRLYTRTRIHQYFS